MRILCVFARYNYGDPSRGEGYEFSNFIPALRRLGHEVSFFETWDRRAHNSFAELNREFLQTVERLQPDVILSVQAHYEIWLETWLLIRDSGIAATINWATDDSWKYSQFSTFLAPAFHAFATTYPKIFEHEYRRDHHDNVLLSQWAANIESLMPPLPFNQCRYKVSFVGTAHGSRRDQVEALRKMGIEVECFGHGWDTGAVAGSDVPRIIRDSIISLNFSNAPRMMGIVPSANQIKARTFEVPGAGGFLVTDRAENLERYYELDEEIVVFDGLADLAQKIRYYLTHPEDRDRIAQAGHARTRNEHTYDVRLKSLIEFAIARYSQFFSGGRSPSRQIDWQRFARVEAKHELTPNLRLFKDITSRIASIVWGPVRGPRAARRIIYELSWRLRGKQTYTAAGLPGRMFYEVS